MLRPRISQLLSRSPLPKRLMRLVETGAGGGMPGSRLPLDGSKNLFEPRDLPASLPAPEIDRLELPEPERRRSGRERQRDEPTFVAARAGLVAHPRAFDRRARPEHDDDVGTIQRLLDLLRILRAATDVLVPPDRVACFFERRSDHLRGAAIVTVVAQEYAGHEQPLARAMLLSNSTFCKRGQVRFRASALRAPVAASHGRRGSRSERPLEIR